MICIIYNTQWPFFYIIIIPFSTQNLLLDLLQTFPSFRFISVNSSELPLSPGETAPQPRAGCFAACQRCGTGAAEVNLAAPTDLRLVAFTPPFSPFYSAQHQGALAANPNCVPPNFCLFLSVCAHCECDVTVNTYPKSSCPPSPLSGFFQAVENQYLVPVPSQNAFIMTVTSP